LLRGFDPESDEGAAGWLASGGEAVREDLLLTGCTARDEEVEIVSTRPAEDPFGAAHTVLTLADGRDLVLGYSAQDDAPVEHLGDAASGRLFPADYRPPGLSLAGGAFRLTTCATGSRVKARVLWPE
jgi:hypothetical protein